MGDTSRGETGKSDMGDTPREETGRSDMGDTLRFLQTWAILFRVPTRNLGKKTILGFGFVYCTLYSYIVQYKRGNKFHQFLTDN